MYIALTSFLHVQRTSTYLHLMLSHCSQEAVKERLAHYYAIMGMINALRLILDSGFKPVTSEVCSACILI